MIIILGSERDLHAQIIYERLKERGSSCCYLDTLSFPKTLKMSLTPSDPEEAGYLMPSGEGKIWLSDVQSVYWRYHHGIVVDERVEKEIAGLVSREIESALGSLFRNMPHATWVNPVDAVERHRYKTHQLMLMRQHGIAIPNTLVTNDPEAVRSFYDRFDGNVIFKPVAGGAYATLMTKGDLTAKRLDELCKSPVQFQNYIKGVDIRVYVVGQSLYAAEIQAETPDFREDMAARIVPVQLPAEIEAACHKLTQLFEYRFTGIDIRRTPEGNYIFLEANPSPMFIHFEEQTGYPISASLLKLLLHETPVGG